MTGVVQRLRYAYRYSAQPVVFRENVAEHSFWTALIGSTMAIDVYGDVRLAENVALRGLLHDGVQLALDAGALRRFQIFDTDARHSFFTLAYRRETVE